jgi:galactoside O-acetyltransferase
VIRGGENIEIGDGFTSLGDAYLYANQGRLRIGRNLCINTNVQLGAAGGEITIGDDVLIGPNVVIRAADHRAESGRAIREQGHVGGRIEIGNDVWIAANVVILRDVRLGNGCIVAAGAVVNREVKANEIVGGVPARSIGRRG